MSRPNEPSEPDTPETAPPAGDPTPPAEPQQPPLPDPEAPPPADPAKPKTLDELLSALDDDARKVVLDQVSKARGEAKNLRDRLKAAEPKAAEYDKAVEAQKTAEQKAKDAADAATKRAAGLLERAVRGEIKALAADRFADPDDPAGFLDLAKYAGDDGEVDTAAIQADLDDLLARKPHLAKPAAAAPRPPAPNRAQGTSGNGSVSLEQQIAEAKSKGDIRRAIQLENSKLAK